MDAKAYAESASALLADYDPGDPAACATALRDLWRRADPVSMAGIAAEERRCQETLGIPVPILKAIGKALGTEARGRVPDFIPLTQVLWDGYGREGRVVSLVTLGPMELSEPETIVPLLRAMCRTCLTWEDSDRLAMNALEPIVRKCPEEWLPRIKPWLGDGSKWVRRSSVTVVGRLPMKHPGYTTECLELSRPLIVDCESEVRKAVSFAIRLCARGDTGPVVAFLARLVPPADATETWVLCDVIRSMARKLLPDMAPLLGNYEAWSDDPGLAPKDRRSVESAIRVLRRVSS